MVKNNLSRQGQCRINCLSLNGNFHTSKQKESASEPRRRERERERERESERARERRECGQGVSGKGAIRIFRILELAPYAFRLFTFFWGLLELLIC